MSLTRTEAQERSNTGRSNSGWIKEEDGSFIGSEVDFPNNLHLTQEFEEYAKRTRASWSVLQYLRVALRQYLDHRRNNQDKL